MIDWTLSLKICFFGLSAVFGSLLILIASIYAFGFILKNLEKKEAK